MKENLARQLIQHSDDVFKDVLVLNLIKLLLLVRRVYQRQQDGILKFCRNCPTDTSAPCNVQNLHTYLLILSYALIALPKLNLFEVSPSFLPQSSSCSSSKLLTLKHYHQHNGIFTYLTPNCPKIIPHCSFQMCFTKWNFFAFYFENSKIEAGTPINIAIIYITFF